MMNGSDGQNGGLNPWSSFDSLRNPKSAVSVRIFIFMRVSGVFYTTKWIRDDNMVVGLENIFEVAEYA
jgi:hypothetical protein